MNAGPNDAAAMGGDAGDPAANPAIENAADKAPAQLPISERAAIIFVPGISRSWADHSLGAVADDIIVALNKRSSRAHSASGVGTQSYGVGPSPPVARHITLSRTTSDGGATEAMIDLYEFDYTRLLAARFDAQSLVWRALLVVPGLIAGAITLVKNVRGGAKTFVELLQVIFLGVVLFLYAFLLIALVASIGVLAAETLGSAFGGAANGTPPEVEPSPTATPTPTPAVTPPSDGASDGNPLGSALEFLAAVAVQVFTAAAAWVAAVVLPLSALLWLALPPRYKIKEFLTNAATDYLAVDHYVRRQEGAEDLHGRLENLMATLGDLGYRRVDVVSYSFGSVVAFNVVFPGQPPDARGPISTIDTLVTIGSPYDIVRRIREKYFTNRHALSDHPKRWINVYVPSDVLGSNFRNDSHREQPADEVLQAATAQGGQLPTPENVVYLPGGIPQDGPAWGDLFGFRGLRVHARYWDPGELNERTCFDKVVAKLYGDDPIICA